MLQRLADCLQRAKAHLLIVSGDLTQRARKKEFQQARKFLDRVASPRLVVPGNHDVSPWFYPLHRWARPLTKYREEISHDTEPLYTDDEIAVVGVNTTRRNTVQQGRVNALQVERACNRLNSLPPNRVRLVVTHHPFDLPRHYRGHDVVGRATMAMSKFAQCGADAFLSGHLHVSHVGETTLRYRIPGYAALIIQAGTAVSTRVRGELNSWNLLTIARPLFAVDRYVWNAGSSDFVLAGRDDFLYTPQGWQRRRVEDVA